MRGDNTSSDRGIANQRRRTWRDLDTEYGTAMAEALGASVGPGTRCNDPECDDCKADAAALAARSSTRWDDGHGDELVTKRSRSREEWALLWAKSVCWRAISTGTLFLVAWLYTGDAGLGGVVALIHMVITIVIYVPHDLAWERYSARRQQRRHTKERQS